MEEQKNNEEAGSFYTMKEPVSTLVDEKLDELIVLLSAAKLGKNKIEQLQQKFNAAAEHAAGESYHAGGIFQSQKLNSRTARNYTLAKKASRILRMAVALLMILLGFGMIIMPAPPYFEMFTLFYLNPNDGVTIMDVISLIVAFTGISLFISSLIKFSVP